MKKIIVATDFSSAAANAANYAADMALAINAELLLMNAYEYPLSYSEVPLAISMADIQKQAEADLSKLKEDLKHRTNGKLSIETIAVEGVFYAELKNLCTHIKPYSVVIGTQGKTAAERIFLGSHAVYVMKHLEYPVIAVPPNSKFTTIKKIGFACDFEKVVDYTPVDEIRELVNNFKAELHVLNTGGNSVYNSDVVFQSGLIQEMFFDLKPIYHFINNNNIDEGTMEFAETNSIDLLIVLPKQHSLIERILFKSHVRQFVLHSHIPVMALHE
jgi:nucleotide-binding universal stress UspA family protein